MLTLRVLRFSPLLKNQHFQIPIRSWNAWPRLNELFELLGAPRVNKFTLHFIGGGGGGAGGAEAPLNENLEGAQPPTFRSRKYQ